MQTRQNALQHLLKKNPLLQCLVAAVTRLRPNSAALGAVYTPSFQVITSQTRKYKRHDARGNVVWTEEPVWNWAVANITVCGGMAHGVCDLGGCWCGHGQWPASQGAGRHAYIFKVLSRKGMPTEGASRDLGCGLGIWTS